MSELFYFYYAAMYGLSLYWTCKIPSSLKPVDNLWASSICAMFGFVFWPLFLAAFIKTRKPS